MTVPRAAPTPSSPAASRRSPVRKVFDQSSAANRQLVLGLVALLVAVIGISIPAFLTWTPGVDLEIPLRAASRWAGGGQAYAASAFSETSGPGLPFLYPPWLLPILAPLAALPREAVTALWLAGGVAVGAWTCRRLSVPWVAVPIAMIWPPFMEGLVTGNVQLWQFAAFAALFYRPSWNWQPVAREVAGVTRPEGEPAEAQGATPMVRRDATNGLLAAGVGALKYTQLLPLAWLLRWRPRAAVAGGVALAAVALATLPFTGLGLYRDWLDQLGRAADPSWAPAGAPLAVLVGRPVALAAAAAAVVAMFFVRGRDAGAWVGIALLVAAPSIHGYGMLFLLPALLTIRRDLALALAVIIARYDPLGWWIAIGIAAVALAASSRWPALRAAARADGAATAPTGATL